MSRIEQIAYICQRFHVCYWARSEAINEGREYSDMLYRISAGGGA